MEFGFNRTRDHRVASPML